MPHLSYAELLDSQLPALDLLQRLGYSYLSPEQALACRDGSTSNVLLETILTKQLQAINSYSYKGQKYRFSDATIRAAVRDLKTVPREGLIRTNEAVYELLSLGKSYEEHIGRDKKSFPLRFIDWENIENNHFAVSDEFTVSGLRENRRPDIVLFVNGIPFVILENKRRDKSYALEESISQMQRNQREEEGIPRLFYYAQLLLAVEPNQVKYATVGTQPAFWSIWKEEIYDVEAAVQRLLEQSIPGLSPQKRLPTEQDRILYSLCTKERLMALVRQYIVFDGGQKKIARYQQYFAVQASLQRILQVSDKGIREGGVIWHTQGSGKSLTMVMLSKAIRLSKAISNPRVVIVTDRISLDKQIHKTFHQCGVLSLAKAKSGADLAKLICETHTEVITTITDKFDTALRRNDFSNTDANIFVMVDESHRSQYGRTHARMKKVLPNACYLGFTGTPLMKKEKNTARKFGGYIHVYSIDKAVRDGAVLPLLYESRLPKLKTLQAQLDRGFDRVMEPLNEYETKDFKRKFSHVSKLYEAQQVIEEIAYDISHHYCKNWQGTGFKAQLTVPKIDTAIKYQQYFERQTNPKLKINSFVVFTPPDSRAAYEDVWSDTQKNSQCYWNSLMARYTSQETYETHVVEGFKEEHNEVELIIVVNKLLTGFDAPRNTVLYLAKPLAEHNLLQAIARVNRLFKGKEYGYIIDYVGVLGKLDEALHSYSALEGFEEEDLADALTNVITEVRKVPLRYSAVWEVFKEVPNQQDKEALERYLAPQDRRDLFYERLSAFARSLKLALSTDEFYKEYTDARIEHWIKELKWFQQMRKSVQKRYAEVVDYREYEAQVRKLLDTYVSVEEIESIHDPINIFDKNLQEEEILEQGGTPASVADTIAHQLKKTVIEKMDEDPVFYMRFSQLIEAAIESFQSNRLSEKNYLEQVLDIQQQYQTGGQSSTHNVLQDKPKARAFYGMIKKVLEERKPEANLDTAKLAQAGEAFDQMMQDIATVDWKSNPNKPAEIANKVEDYFLSQREQFGVNLSYDDIDEIITFILKIAKRNY